MSEKPLLADQAIEKLLEDYEFHTVLDVGCGDGRHATILRQAGKEVTAVDLRPQLAGVIAADYLEHEFARQFDCVWLSHVLEHQLNVHTFLRKVFGDLKEGGVLAVTVPPLKHEIVGGHFTLWNAGLLLYNLIVAGFDCSKARVKQYGYNISVLVRKVPAALPLGALRFGDGDIEKLARFFPKSTDVKWTQSFSGNIAELNWDDRAADSSIAAWLGGMWPWRRKKNACAPPTCTIRQEDGP